MKLSSHFDSSEFVCRHCGSLGPGISPKLIAKLETLRERIEQPIYISSGYRCPAHNKAIGGASRSQHLKGTAADIVAKGSTPAQLKAACELTFGYRSGIGLYPGFVHVDVRNGHARW